MGSWGTTIKDLEERGLRRQLRVMTGIQGKEICLSGREVLNFCSNNYLGLASHPEICQAAEDNIRHNGLGTGASRLVCGNHETHEELERKLCTFKGTERCLVFSSGYMANVGILSGLFGPEDLIFSDRLNHASIVDGILLSRARFKRYPHIDMLALEALLKKETTKGKKVIVTDSVFSMDGDVAPLDAIVALARKYDCLVMVDEAHALGVLGKKGKGAVEHFGLDGQIDIQMGTLSKAVGAFGAYCCGQAEMVDVLLSTARSFIYTTGMPPSVAAAAIKGIDLIEQQPELRESLWKNTRYMLDQLKRLGFNTLHSQTPIIPVVIGNVQTAMRFSEELLRAGIFVSAIRPPTVPKDTARLRLTVMASHTQAELDYLVQQMKRIGQDLCVI